MTRCTGQGCVHWAKEGALCERCQWLTAIGVLVETIMWGGAEPPVWRTNSVASRNMLLVFTVQDAGQWRGLDAVAFLLRDYAQLKKAWRELHTEAEEEGISRAARDSFSAGLLEGLDQRNRG